MDTALLLSSCKQGDLARVRHLVEECEVEINTRDKWDSTPLYYACLCGHENIVHYLLENGARCEAHTFDGERCLYGALNIEIRNLLRNYKVIKLNTTYECYRNDLRRILDNEEHTDIKFIVNNNEFLAHRCILSARSPYFMEILHNKWMNRRTIHINNSKVSPAAFKAILQYIYTDQLEVALDEIEDVILLAKQCRLSELLERIEESVKKSYTFQCMKPGTRVTTFIIEPKGECLHTDFSILGNQVLPFKFRQWVNGNELPFLPNPDLIGFEDVCILVEDDSFFCHKVFMCGRSDYFKAMLLDHFNETECRDGEHIISIRLNDISSDIFIHILNYIYQDFTKLTEETVYETLCAADLYLLPGLKKLCASYFYDRLMLVNCITVFRLSKLFQLHRLENQVTEFMSQHVYQLVDNPEFEQIVLEEAAAVKNREEVDSVPLLDDIRYHITSNVQTISAMDEVNDKLAVIDKLLEKLQLDG